MAADLHCMESLIQRTKRGGYQPEDGRMVLASRAWQHFIHITKFIISFGEYNDC